MHLAVGVSDSDWSVELARRPDRTPPLWCCALGGSVRARQWRPQQQTCVAAVAATVQHDDSGAGQAAAAVIETLHDVHLLQVTVAAGAAALPPAAGVQARDVLYHPGDYMLQPMQPPPPQTPQQTSQRAAAMSQLGTVYATKRRRRNGKSLKPPPKDGVAKSNPSKRHRERLNAELDTLASLLPFEQNILSKLDRLSILRLSVSYLRTKSYFHVVMHRDKEDGLHDPVQGFRSRDLTALDHSVLDGDMFLQALNGFLLILTCEGEVFFATHTIESYLGFHQSDIVHQSVYELVHSEDREELQRQLLWNSFLPAEHSACSLPEALLPENSHLLERSFTVRFRCLLDNTSGFLRLDIRGRVKALHGQNRRTEEPPLALFAVCTPFGPPSLLEVPQKEVMFKSKHKLDLAHVSMDQRGKLLLGYSDAELANMGGYHLVHFDDLAYVASAHQELLKTGASGMIAYRYQTKDGSWQWLQTSSRLVYKNSKPDFVISTHRPLMEEEGRDLLGKRTMDFKVSYLDAGLSNSYFTDSDMPAGGAASSQSSPCTSPPAQSTPHGAPRVNRRYKTQLRDFLSTCRTKRKLQAQPAAQQQPTVAQPTTQQQQTEYVAELQATASPPAPPTSSLLLQSSQVISPSGSSSSSSAAVAAAAAAATAAAAAAYSGMYYSTGTGDWHQASQAAPNFHQQLYPSDNRFLADNLFHQYRALPPYYPDYHHAAVAAVAAPAAAYNGYLDVSSPPPRYEVPSKSPSGGDDRLYSCQLDRTSNYLVFPHQHEQLNGLQQDKKPKLLQGLHGHSPPAAGSPEQHNGLVKLEQEKDLQGYHPANDTRQTVLMWGSGSAAPPVTTAGSRPSSAASLHGYLHEQDSKCKSPGYMQQQQGDPLKSLAEMNSTGENKSWYQQQTQQQQHGGKPRLGSPPGQYQESRQQQQLGGSQQLPPNPPSNSSEISGRTSNGGGGGLKQQQQQERSPLLSISEVTNTLLEHGGD